MEKSVIERLCDADLALRGEGPDRSRYVVVMGDNKKPDLAAGKRETNRELALPETV